MGYYTEPASAFPLSPGPPAPAAGPAPEPISLAAGPSQVGRHSVFQEGSCFCHCHYSPIYRYREHGLIYLPIRVVDKVCNISYGIVTGLVETVSGKDIRRDTCGYCGRYVCHHALMGARSGGRWGVKDC